VARLFGTDGVRGLANRDLTAELALDLSVAAAHVLGEAGEFAGHRPVAVVGRDPRASGEFLEATDYDLRAHQNASGEDLSYFDQEHESRYLPYVVEPAVGVDRALLTFLLDAYRVEEVPTAKGGTDKRTVLGLHRDLAPIKVAVLPLSRNEKLGPEARRVHDLVKPHWITQYDDAGAIGRRYRRQDEVGTPFCVTVDFDTLDDRQVTVRERDTMQQDRIAIDALVPYLLERL
jgi:glycyl-tRNA synthetase